MIRRIHRQRGGGIRPRISARIFLLNEIPALALTSEQRAELMGGITTDCGHREVFFG